MASSSSHHTGTGGDKYYSGTAVELAICTHTPYLEWQQLVVVGGTANTGMLMSGGLCLEAAASAKPSETTLAAAAPPPILGRRVNPRQATRQDLEATRALGLLAEVRVTVTATNGLANAHINEIRLYGEDGVAPFPIQPKAAA